MLVRFVIYGCIGWIMESLWTGLGSALKGDKNLRCTTYLWMFPIYGLGGIFLESAHEMIREFLWIYRGFIWATLIFTIELIAGWILKITIGRCPWDYDQDVGVSVVTIRGFVRFDYLPVWFSVGLFFERVHDFVRMIV